MYDYDDSDDLDLAECSDNELAHNMMWHSGGSFVPQCLYEYFYLMNSQSNPSHFKFGMSDSSKALKGRIKERTRQVGLSRLAGYKECLDSRTIEKEFKELCKHIEKSIKKPFFISREVIDLNVLGNCDLECVVVALKETGVTCPNLVRINEDTRDYWLDGSCLYSIIKPITFEDL